MNPPPALGRARHLTRTWLSEQPALYLPLARRRYPGPSPQVVGVDTELVIDAYTRAASTHMVYAFQLAQPRPVRLAHHLHAPAQVIAATRRALPTLVLVREPDGTALSQAAREPHVTVRDALLAHARYHERLLPYRDSVVVADFDEVTRDPRAAVQRINDRFGTTFALPAEDEPLVAELIGLRPTHWPTLLAFESGQVPKQELLRALSDPTTRPAPPEDSEAWLPSERRRQAKEALRADLHRPELVPLRTRARAAYRAFLGGDE
ncbi:hypothetical protein [Petropleomorpha daqingensis]|uniref:Sulfotransferase family protein n=1 Tax=Petropleomorpha daqingensis TaxID=2026353 RepID=A0A853CF94_9ACTN|nr:hypothetical protein [Petropleomorpha daqingensis]NYJ05836.1 hypothetical protein [Petropleomorpha daqingensis]